MVAIGGPSRREICPALNCAMTMIPMGRKYIQKACLFDSMQAYVQWSAHVKLGAGGAVVAPISKINLSGRLCLISVHLIDIRSHEFACQSSFFYKESRADKTTIFVCNDH